MAETGEGTSTEWEFGVDLGLVSLQWRHVKDFALFRLFGSPSQKTLQLRFPIRIVPQQADYYVSFPIINAQGQAEGATLEWRVLPKGKWRGAPIDNRRLWDDWLNARLPSSYAWYHGNWDKRTQCTDLLVGRTPPHTLVIHGPGGIGKTAFLRAVLSSIDRHPWRAVGFTAKNMQYDPIGGGTSPREKAITTITEAYQEVAKQLSIPIFNKGVEALHADIQRKLREERRVLFVLDNLEELTDFERFVPICMGLVPEPPRGTIVVTSRVFPENAPKNAAVLRLERLDAGDIAAIMRDVFVATYQYKEPIPFNDVKRMVDMADGNPLIAKWAVNEYVQRGDRGAFLREAAVQGIALEYLFGSQWSRLTTTEQVIIKTIARMGPIAVREEEIIGELQGAHGRAGTTKALQKLKRFAFLDVSRSETESSLGLHSKVREWLSSVEKVQ